MSKNKLISKPDETNVKADTKNPSWWQWFLIYPAFGVALISAVPDWLDKFDGVMTPLFNPDHVEATQLVRFMKKNASCVASPISWVEISDQTKVDGTICDATGDVWLRVQSKDVALYKGIEISELLTTKSDSAGIFDISAYASTALTYKSTKEHYKNKALNGVKIAQLAVVLCQQFKGNKITRYLRNGDQCFKEIVDANNGIVLSTSEVECDQTCG